MTDRRSVLRPPIPGLAIAALLALAPLPASAWPEDRGFDPPRVRRVIRMRPEAMFVAPPVILRGYRPRNHNVPLYNEPPGIGAFGGPAR